MSAYDKSKALIFRGGTVAVSGVSSGDLADEETARIAGDAASIQRANHTGTQAISTITGLQTALDARVTEAVLTPLLLALDATVAGKATGAQGALADTAVQPAALAAEVARATGAEAALAAQLAALPETIDLPSLRKVAVDHLVHRPGDAAEHFAAVADAVVVVNADGAALRTNDSRQLSALPFVPLEPDSRYEARFAYRRHSGSSDPANDAVVCGVDWYSAAKVLIGSATLSTDLTLTTGARREVSRLIARGADQGAQTVAPSAARYARAWVYTYGTDHETDIEICALERMPSDPTSLVLQSLEAETIDVGTITVEDDLILPEDFVFPPENIPSFPVARTFYVTMGGNDANAGSSLSKPLRSVPAALAKMAAMAPAPCVTIVHPGEYLVPRNTEIPQNCALYGYDVRVTKLLLADAAGTAAATSDADRRQNMFLLNSGIKLRGFTFVGMRHEPYTFDVLTGSFAPPQKGFVCAFKPGAMLTRSPYIADCTCLHDLTQDQLLLPTDRAAGNPLMPVGGGGLLADGSVLSLDSPLRSVVVDGFTTVNPNGIGYVITRNAIVQLVSVFTNWSRIGVWTHSGGQVTLANSNNTFGDFAFVSTGFRAAVRIDGAAADVGAFPSTGASVVEANIGAILNALYNPGTGTGLFTARAGWGTLTAAQKDFARRDAETLLRAIIRDYRSGQDRGTQYFIKGLFDWNAGFVFAPSLKNLFLGTFDDIETAVKGYVTSDGAVAMLEGLIGLVKEVIAAGDQPLGTSPYKVAFPSVVEATGQQFSNSGAGVNYNSLPFSQRGTSETIDPNVTLVEANGGVIYATFATESGDTYLGKDLRVDFRRSTIEGQAFSRGVQNIALPLIVALGA